jgi:CBS domain containing-hemolysin-like protein
MLSLLVTVVIFSLVVSALCSLTEAALYSVPLVYVRHLAESGSRSGKKLLVFKEDMARPISAILILNTFANTAGPAVGGALAAALYGDRFAIIFAIFITAAVLFLSEIIPKILGVSYCKQVARVIAGPTAFVVTLFAPILWISGVVSRRLAPEEDEPSVSQEEVLSMAALGTEEGTLDHFEGSVIENVLGLDRTLVRDVLTPRVSVFRVNEQLTLGEAQKEIPEWNFTRVPLYAADDPDQLQSYVRQRDLFREILKGNTTSTLKELARPLQTVPELMKLDQLLLQMFEDKEHICAVVDEHGALAGIITLEDVLEEIVGREIVDEYDLVKKKGARISDLAKVKHQAKR